MNKNAKSFLIGVLIGLPIALSSASQRPHQAEAETIDFKKYVMEQILNRVFMNMNHIQMPSD